MNEVLREEIAPAAEVTIAGKSYSLVYDLQAVILYKQKTGDSLFQEGAFTKVNPQQDPERFAACLWAGLQRKQPELSYEALCEKIPFGPAVGQIAEQMSKAIFAHFPKAKPGGSSPNEPAPDPPAPSPVAPISPSSAPAPASISA